MKGAIRAGVRYAGGTLGMEVRVLDVDEALGTVRSIRVKPPLRHGGRPVTHTISEFRRWARRPVAEPDAAGP